MNKHTPGPWKVGNSHSNYIINHQYGDGSWGYLMSLSSVVHGEAEEANAKLIAAAPELLEALERVSTFFESSESYSQEWRLKQELGLVIAKARGAAQ